MLQMHLSDKQFYCLLRCILYKRFEGIHVFIFFCLVGPWMTCTSTVVVHPHIWLMCCLEALLPHPSPLLGTGREPRAWVSDLMTSCCFPGPLCGDSTRSPMDSAHKNLVIRALIFVVPCFLKESKGDHKIVSICPFVCLSQLLDAVTAQLLGRFTPSPVLWNCLGS